MPKKKTTPKADREAWKNIVVNKEEWTPERFARELLDNGTGRPKPFTDENKAALYSLTREEALQLEPRIFARWKFYHHNQELTKNAGHKTAKRNKELKDWSSQIRKMLADPDLTATMINQKKMPKWLNAFDTEDGVLPTPSEVIGATLMAKAMTGDVRAIEELRKMGFGDKVTIDAGESFFNKQALRLEIVDPSNEIKVLEAEEFKEEKEVTPVLPKEEPTPEPVIKETQPIPEELRKEFEEHEKQINTPKENPNLNEHGIDRTLLNRMVITKNKNRK